MTVTQKLNKISNVMQVPLIVIFELVLIARMISLYYLINPKFDSLISWGLVILSVVCFFNFFIQRIKNKNWSIMDLLLLLFIIVLLITTFINREHGFFENAKLIMWQGIYFFVIFDIGKLKNKKILYMFEAILVGVWFILVGVSLLMFISKFGYTFQFQKLYYGIRLGLIQNRLYGVFVDPNYASTISIITILSSMHLLHNFKKVLVKIFLVLNIVFQFSYIVLSGSRSAEVQMIVVILTGIFFLLYDKNRKKNLLKKIIIPIILSIISCMILFAGIQFVKVSWTWVANHNSSYKISEKIISENKKEHKKNKQIHEDGKVTLARNDVSDNDDISNSRFSLWKSSFEIFEKNPIFGASPKNLFEVAREQLPETYIAKHKQTSHNFFFYLLATTGISGTLIFMIFLLINMKRTLYQLLFQHSVQYEDFLINTEIVLTVLISACLVTDMILMNRLAAFTFWFILGYIQNNKSNQEKALK